MTIASNENHPQISKLRLVSATSQPMEIVCVDYISLAMSKGGFENILVFSDQYTVPARNQFGEVTAEALFNHFILHHGFPKRLHSDKGAQFESHLIKELCKLVDILTFIATPYNPSSNINGITERLNRSYRTLLSILGTLNTKDKHDWKSQIDHLFHA